MLIVYTDLGLPIDRDAMAESRRWLNDYTAELFDRGLPWCAGRKSCWKSCCRRRHADGAGHQYTTGPHRDVR